MMDFTEIGNLVTDPSFWGIVVLCLIGLGFIKVLYDYFTTREPKKPDYRIRRNRWDRYHRQHRHLAHK